MSMRDLFQGEFDFNSNDSLDTQITASIDRGDFYLSVLSLLMLTFWSIYLLFFNSTILGFIVSIVLRKFVRNGFIRLGSISFSALGGKMMLRDLAYMNNDCTIRCCYVIVVFNYWVRFSEIKESERRSGSRCLYVYMYGLDVHLYNRSRMYDELQSLFKPDASSNHGSLHGCSLDTDASIRTKKRVAKRFTTMKIADPGEQAVNDNKDYDSGGVLDVFWSHAYRLITAVKFNLELIKICAGNHLLPQAFTCTCSSLIGAYTQEAATFESDKYQHKIVADFANMFCSLIPVSEYAGQHAVEEPPKTWEKAFHLFEFGRGKLCYIQDEPGLVADDFDHLLESGDNAAVVQTWPRQDLSVQVTRNCRLYYGPWADRQREILWRFFFPATFKSADISDPPLPGRPRAIRKFVVEVRTSTEMSLELFFSNRSTVQSLQFIASFDSTVKLSIPWLTGPDGFRTTLRISLAEGKINAQHLWTNVLRSKQLDLDLHMYYPRGWNMLHQWTIDVKAKHPQLTMLYDYKRFFKGLIDDWVRGSQPDLLQFVPCIYKFHVSADNLDFILLANDYNWISTAQENAYVAFNGKRFSLSFELPFVDYLPNTVSVIYAIEGVSAKVSLALPETSTMLHVMREQHGRLKLVDRSGRLQHTNPFEIRDEPLCEVNGHDQPVHRYWFECARAPLINLKIGHTYHPSPYTSQFWRFLPRNLQPPSPDEKVGCHSIRHRHRKPGSRRRETTTTQSSQDSSNQADLEELALGGLRPEGSQLKGPTEDFLLRGNFDLGYLTPDTVDVHLHIPNAQLCFYGSLLRHFIHLKENYFGYYQDPVDFSTHPLTAEEYMNKKGKSALESDALLFRSLESRIVDPRQYRPIRVRLSLEFHNIQAHLPMHGSSCDVPCPTAFLDCVGFEMDKRWDENNIQLILSPILLCLFDQCQASRPKSSNALSVGRIQLMGLCLRGQGLFSHTDLPLDAETLEYAWLLELTVGQLTGQLTVPQLTSVVHAVNGFVFAAVDSENQLRNSKSFVLCQHSRPQTLCPNRPSFVSNSACPSEAELKYRFFRLFFDGLDVGVVETGCCLSLQLNPVRLANCNKHGPTRSGGLLLVLPGIRLIQYIRPIDGPIGGVSENPNLASDQRSLWLKAGSLSLGPVYVNITGTTERAELSSLRRIFLKHHDLSTRRLRFLWSKDPPVDLGDDYLDSSYLGDSPRKITAAMPNLSPNCGCYGNCSFFGCNHNGRVLFLELSTGHFRPRAVFPPKDVYKPHLFSLSPSTGVSDGIFHPVYSGGDNSNGPKAVPATYFGESLLVAHRLLHELHNPNFCRERSNGLAFMRDEILRVCIADIHGDNDSAHSTVFSDDSDFSSEEEEEGKSCSLSSSGASGGSSPDSVHRSKRRYSSEGRLKKVSISPEPNSRLSSMSELLVSLDSPNEDEPAADLPTHTAGGTAFGAPLDRSFVSHLPSNLSLNSLISPMDLGSHASSPNLSRDLSVPYPTEQTQPPTLPRRRLAPTPPPRRFVRASAEDHGLDTELPGTSQTFTSAAVGDSQPNDDDLLHRFVDLRTQLNRPITESSLLRSAYSHHLSVYKCRSTWDRIPRLRHRWHIPKRLLRSESSVAAESNSDPFCLPRMGLGMAPLFHLVKTGFSPNLLVNESENLPCSCFNRKTEYSSALQTSGTRVKKIELCSGAHISLQNSVNILISPLFIESLERYLGVLSPILSVAPPSAVVDGMHANCVKIRLSQLHRSPHPTPPSITQDPTHNAHSEYPPYVHSNWIAPTSHPVTQPSASLPGEKSIRPDNPQQKVDISEQDARQSHPTRDVHVTPLLTGKITSFFVERINICSLQLYAVEDLVHLDSIRSGLHDLTCVSLLTFGVDSLSFKFLSCCETDSLVTPYPAQPITPAGSECSSSESQSGVPLLQRQCQKSFTSGSKKTSDFHVSPLDSSFVHSDRLASSTSLPQTNRPENASSAQAARLSFHSRQPSAPPALQPAELVPNVEHLSDTLADRDSHRSLINYPALAGKSERSVTGVISATEDDRSALPLYVYPTEKSRLQANPHQVSESHADFESLSNPSRLKKLNRLRLSHTLKPSETVCELNVHRIHGQLRRLTHLSQFSSNVLLTAIPFESSKVFFSYDSDKDLHSNITCAPQSLSTSWDEHSAGWIMFECGLEHLSCSFDRRNGFSSGSVSCTDPSEQVETVAEVKSRPEFTKKASEPYSKQRTESLPSRGRVGKSLSSRKKKSLMMSSLKQHELSSKSDPLSSPQAAGHVDSTDTHVRVPSHSLPQSRRNCVLSRLHVTTVWLNFPTPKRLPNKRRVELIRSDWNLLSTAAPSIKAWVDPCGKLVSHCRKFYSNVERRLLAVTTCLMTEVVSGKLASQRNSFVVDCFQNKGFDAYDRNRTPAAHVLRFDPSCQLFVLLRRYLYTLDQELGSTEADRRLGEFLKDSVVPPNDLLQSGILLLTREWRILVQLLAIAEHDLLVKLNGEHKQHLFSTLASSVGLGPDSIKFTPESKCTKVSSRSRKLTTPNDLKVPGIVPSSTNFIPDSTTSHLLSVAAGPISPAGRCNPADSKGQTKRNSVKGFVNEYYADDHSSEHMGFPRTEPVVQQSFGPVNAGPIQAVDNPVLHRFLRDTRSPVIDIPLEAVPETTFSTLRPREFGGYHDVEYRLPPPKAPFRRASDPTMRPLLNDNQSTPGDNLLFSGKNPISKQDKRELSDQSDNSGSQYHSNEPSRASRLQDFHSPPRDVPMTNLDFEQAIHLSNQCQHLAFTQRLFSPLLEAVGLNAKGIRRTTLMNKFGGFFSVEGLLRTFQIEIVSSVRNPLCPRNMSHAPSMSSNRPNLGPQPNLVSKNYRTSTSRHAAFSCHSFSSKLSLRDVLDQTDQQISKTNAYACSSELNVAQTTTNMEVMLNIGHLRQHINLPLLRLVHQFVTVFYCIRDMRKTIQTHQPVVPVGIPSVGLAATRKQESKASSEGTDGTMPSRSSGYVRFDEGSLDTGEQPPTLYQGQTSSAGATSLATGCEQLIALDPHSSDRESSTSMDKVSQKADFTGGFPLDSGTDSQSKRSDLLQSALPSPPPPSTFTVPTCWRRLISYVELYSTVPKSKTVALKDLGYAMPTITEEDREVPPHSPGNIGQPNIERVPDVAVLRSNMLGRRLLTSVSYQPLNDDTESGLAYGPQVNSNISESPRIPIAPSVLADYAGANAAWNPSANQHETEPVVRTPASGFESITYPWVSSERVPLIIFVSTRIDQMAVTAVLSELNLAAMVRSTHGSFTHSTRVRGRGRFTERFSGQCLFLHYNEGQIQLTEHSTTQSQVVVSVKSGPSHALISARQSHQSEKNACLLSVGRVSITLPHHPVQLHGVVQRQAKRISHTVFELLRSSPAGHNPLRPWSFADPSLSSASRLVTTPTTGSSTTITTSDVANSFKPQKLTPQPNESRAVSIPNVANLSSPPLVFSLQAVAQGLTINVALHPSLTAVYNLNPVHFAGHLGTRGYVEFNLADHSLSLQSSGSSDGFPNSIKLTLPHILTSVIRRESSGGRYSRGRRKEPMLTRGLTSVQGPYVHIQVKINTLEQTLTTETLNYIVIVVKLFMKEINEVIQKMSGEDQFTIGSGSRHLLNPRTSIFGDSVAHYDMDGLLPRTMREKVKFTIRIRVEEIQLMAIASNGAVKFEARTIDVELTNRVSQACLNANLLPNNPSVIGANNRNKPTTGPVRPSNLKLYPNGQLNNSRPPTFDVTGPGETLFIYATISKLCAELGYLDQDVFFNERSPDFRTLAFFKTAIAMRSLLADEKFASLSPDNHCSLSGEYDAFLISVSRPTIWLKPFTFDRAILIWMAYKRDFSKWQDYMNHLSSLSPGIRTTDSYGRPSQSENQPPSSPRFQVQSSVVSRQSESTNRFDFENLQNSVPSDTIPKLSRTRAPQDNVPRSTLFLQLSVEDLGVCLPINILQSNQQSVEADSRSALVLTLDRCRASALCHDSLVSQCEFTDFCLRFDDEFNVGSDEWKPDWKRASFDVHGKRHILILNACVVPNGTFNVCWRNMEKRAQLHLIIRWQMRGLDFHLDDNIGRRLKALISILTRIAGYDGAAPLLPTSAEEENGDETIAGRDTDQLDGTDKFARQEEHPESNTINSNRSAPLERVPRVLSTQREAYSDIASLDRYQIEAGASSVFSVGTQPLDLSQVRSMEMNKHKQELLDAQYCLAFKRQKWDTLRRKRVLNAPRSPLALRSPVVVRTAHWVDSELPSQSHSKWTRSMSITAGQPTVDVRSSVHPSISEHLKSSEPPCSPPISSSATLSSLDGHRLSVISKDDSVYFDIDPGDSERTGTPNLKTDIPAKNKTVDSFSKPQSFETADTWFDIQDGSSFTRASESRSSNTHMFSIDNGPTDGDDDYDDDQSFGSDIGDVTVKEAFVANSSDATMSGKTVSNSNVGDRPPPPPRRAQFQVLVDDEQTVVQPQVLLKLDLLIHVDSGCCVLHPRPSSEDSASPPDTTNSIVFGVDSRYPTIGFSQRRFEIPSSSATNPHLESAVRFSNAELLSSYIERYRRHLTQDSHFQSTDLTVFLIPAVDVELHYNSVTEMGLQSGTSASFSIPPSAVTRFPETADKPLPVVLSSNRCQTQHNSVTVGCGTECEQKPSGNAPVTEPSIVDLPDAYSHKPVPFSGGVRKQTDLYVSCFLQQLPKELIVHPALLDFLEQTLENLPLVADWKNENVSVSSDGTKVADEKAISTSSTPFYDPSWETFPIHVVVHLHVQPMVMRLLCLPVSRMQCLMSLPSMDIVFSTKRNEIGTSERENGNNSDSKQTAESNTSPGCSNFAVDPSATQFSNRPDLSPSATRSSAHVPCSDLPAEGGLCVTAILKEFRICVFHPYVDSKSVRSDRMGGAAWSGDSLTLVIQDVSFSISRTVQTSFVQLLDSSEFNGSGLMNQSKTASSQPVSPDVRGLHRAVRFSGIFDIGVALFTCDTRRTLEILDIPNAWYRSSLARRFFLGNEDTSKGPNPPSNLLDPMSADRPAEFTSGECKQSLQLIIGKSLYDSPERSERHSLPGFSLQHKTDNPTDSLGRYTSAATDDLLASKRGQSHTTFPTVSPPQVNSKSDAYRKTLQSNCTDQGSGDAGAVRMTSKSTTLMGERGTNTSPTGSLKLVSWEALPMFCVNLKHFNISLFIGSAMGQTRLAIGQLFCNGRVSLHSSGRKNTILSAGVGTCQFVSEGGGVGGEICLVDSEAQVHLLEDPTGDPMHSLDARLSGFQTRIEYMNTNILMVRLSSLCLKLRDVWKLRDAARRIAEQWKTEQTKSPPRAQEQRVPSVSTAATTRGDGLQADTVSSPNAASVCILIAGEIDWDQAQIAVVRTTTPDLLRSIHKVRDYFVEQFNEGRMSLIGRQGSFKMFADRPRPDAQPSQVTQSEVDRTTVDKLLQRYWQRLLYDALQIHHEELMKLQTEWYTTDQCLPGADVHVDSKQMYPVLGGTLQLSGHSLGIACFAGSFRSAPDWAVFNIQYPIACFETEAQHESLQPGAVSSDPSESDGWVNVRQVLSFELGSQPDFRPQMAYVLRVRRGNQPIVRNPPSMSIAEWLEFTFRGADNTVVNFVRNNDPGNVNEVVQLTQFPISFPPPVSASTPLRFGCPSEVSQPDCFLLIHDQRTTGQNSRELVHSTHHGSNLGSPSNNTAPTFLSSDTRAQSSTAASQTRPHPMKVPTEGELLFVLPSISLRITTDQRQTMTRPTIESLPSVRLKEKETAKPPGSTTEPSSQTNLKPDSQVPKRAGSWISGYRTTPTVESPKPSSEAQSEMPASWRPTVKISFQTDFHGFVQLGLIDVPWLPTLISSYLSERLQDYEISNTVPASSGVLGGIVDPNLEVPANDITTRLRALAVTSSPIVQDARTFEVIHWSLSPVCRWLIASNICVPAFDRLLERIGFRKARITIPKWFQRGVMDHLDNVIANLIHASMQLITENYVQKQVTSSITPSTSYQYLPADLRGQTVKPFPKTQKDCDSHRSVSRTKPTFNLPADEA